MDTTKFYEKTRGERLDFIKKAVGLSDQDVSSLAEPLSFENADRMIENAIGTQSIPLGIATNFVINGQDRLVPMAIEEPSVIAAASKGAKIAGVKGGFAAQADEPVMIGQVQVVSPAAGIKRRIMLGKKKILSLANSKSKSVRAIDLQVRELRDSSPNKIGMMTLVELIVNTKDAMGANAVNTMCEAIAPKVEELSGAGSTVVLKILTNYATKRITRCMAVFDRREIGGEEIVKRILYGYALAYSDVYRAVTNNKGIMNGIDAVALATGQDFRALEAAAHAYAARTGSYRSLTRWHRTQSGDLAGEIELPLAVGIIGGAVSSNPVAKVALKILGVKNAKDLAMTMAAVGLAQNLAAMRALASEGIQSGHMRLHARNLAAMAGAKGKEIDMVSKRIADQGNITFDSAEQVLSDLRSGHIR